MTQRTDLPTPGSAARSNQSNKSHLCDLFLAQGAATAPIAPPGKGWKKIWEGARPGDNVETFWLYQHN